MTQNNVFEQENRKKSIKSYESDPKKYQTNSNFKVTILQVIQKTFSPFKETLKEVFFVSSSL